MIKGIAEKHEMEKILKKIARKAGIDLLPVLSKLTGSEFNSLLLEVFNQRTLALKAPQLLNLYRQNRFVKPADIDVLKLRKAEVASLSLLMENGYEAIELSPVTSLGACAVLGPVNQKKIISASRGTQILSDATNAIALHIAGKKSSGANNDEVKYCTTHRHIRTPATTLKHHTTHFTIACMVTSGIDTGNFNFERNALSDQLLALKKLLLEIFKIEITYIKLQQRAGYKNGDALLNEMHDHLSKTFAVTKYKQPLENNYYQGIQFKVVVEAEGNEIEIADGGFVSWTQQLLENKKERLLISGLGIEYLVRLQNKF